MTPIITILIIIEILALYSINLDSSSWFSELGKSVSICTLSKRTNFLLSDLIHSDEISEKKISTLWEFFKGFTILPFYHDNGKYLLYSIVSFFTIGYHLEKRFGKIKFLLLFLSTYWLTLICFIALKQIDYELYLHENPNSWELWQRTWRLLSDSCVSGFACIIAATRLLDIYYYPRGPITVLGFQLSSKYYVLLVDFYLNYLISNQHISYHLAGLVSGLFVISIIHYRNQIFLFLLGSFVFWFIFHVSFISLIPVFILINF